MSTVVETPAPVFMESLTHRHLAGACLAEMHARRLYLAAARLMEERRLHVVAHALRFTAAQEKEHEAIFRGLIAAQGGAPLPLVDDAPILLPHAPAEVLQSIIHGEEEEALHLYPAYARTAAEEGYPRIAGALRRIAETEALHARRFRQYESALRHNTLFQDEGRISWLCLPCGQLHTGHEPPEACTTCGRDRGHFIRSSYYPFLVEG